MEETPVLIVGGGPVGLSSAIVLARHGIESTLVERRPSTTDHPKARAVNLRTMELFRQWEVEEAVCERALAQDFWRFIWCKTLAGEEIARIETVSGQRTDKSPTVRRIVSQDVVEEALLGRARDLAPATLRFSTALESFRQDERGVVAELVDPVSGVRSTCRARYLVAADGASSSIREALRIAMEGPPALAHQLSVYFRANLTPWMAHRPADIYYCTEGDWLAVVNGSTRWLCIARRDPAAPRLTNDDFVAKIRRSVGKADLDVEVISASFWRMGAQTATRFRRGRVFLAGDAAHVMSPTGGFGMNTGIQDAHNLGWKLAAVLDGSASEALLDSYEAERQPVARSNADWSAANARRIWEIQDAVADRDNGAVRAGAEDQIRHISSEGRALGFLYDSTVVISDGSPAPRFSTRTYRPSARPGSRAPHVWLQRNGERVSTLDLFDRGFVLLTGAPANGWREAVESLEPGMRAAVELVTIGEGGELEEPDENWRSVYALEPGGAVLVRPDGHVAWRSTAAVRRPAAVLDSVLRRALALAPAKRATAAAAGSETAATRYCT